MSLPAAAELVPQSLQEISDWLSSSPTVQHDNYGQLLLATNECTGDNALREIQSEVDRIVETLGEHSVIQLRRVTLGQLVSAVNTYATAVVVSHFSGHGGGGFAVHAGSSNRLFVPPPNDLAQIFTACERLQCVVFNACRSVRAAEAFFDNCPTVNYAVYFVERVADEAAHVFAHVFYLVLKCRNWNVEAAFGAARRLLQSYPDHFYERQLPRIQVRVGTPPPAFEVGAPRRSRYFKIVVMRWLVQAEDCVHDICYSIRRELLELIGLDVTPEHIIVEEWKTRWEIRLDNARELETTEAQAKKVFNRLREVFEEPGIKFILESWRDGSLILCLNSSASAFRTVQAVHADGDLSSMLGMRVLDLTQVGVAATIDAPAYVYTRLCAYQTACIERELEPKLRFSLMRLGPIEPSVEPTDRGAASNSAAASTSQGGAASSSAAASSGAAETAAAAASAPQSSTVTDRPGKAPAATVGGDGADVPSLGNRPLLDASSIHGKFLN
uniref:CHAT domain-containing protein n=1 Tax=Chrysotila carterae TaxID=13221 RepID=A0A7S4BNG9_CHRCT